VYFVYCMYFVSEHITYSITVIVLYVPYLFFINTLFYCGYNCFCCSENHICIVLILCSVSFIPCGVWHVIL
jgi:hypothetical protein